MKNDKQALNLFKTYMVLGPDYQRERGPKPIFPKSIVHEIMQYAQYEDWIKTAFDLAALLKRRRLDFITQSEAWAQDPSLNDAKKWLATPDITRIGESYDFFDKTIMPLIKFIANSPLSDKYGLTALMFAATYGHTEALKALLAESVMDVNAMNDGGLTALIWAACLGQTEALKVLLAVPGIDVNAADEYGQTALIRTVIHGKTETLKALLAVPGINVNAATKEGKTALMMAARNGHTEAMQLINEHLAQSEHSNQNKPTLN